MIMERPAILIASVIIITIIVFLLINLWKYNWKNGELKTRIAFMLWAVFKALHIRAMYLHETHGWWMLLSLGAILWILARHYLRKPEVK